MTELNQDRVYLVSGVSVALDEEDGVLIAGILSDSPFQNNEGKPTSTGKAICNLAFTRRQAEFLRERLNEFLKE
ncbi:MAG: hypothetical protein F6K31_23990 [Symploca sp. SIO2G7]|nr:hypothetical protein [Symploca sp. SIO2G7]